MLIYLVRHAQADLHTSLPYHTLPGPPLTPAGLEQAAAAARVLEHCGLARVVSSPWRRCTQTAEPLRVRFGVELTLDDDLGEMQPGESATELTACILRAALSHADGDAVALVSHAAPLEKLLLSLTRGRLELPRPDERGAHIGAGHVWQLLRRGGEWHARHMPEGGVLA